ncbi:uncharacterized protein BDZ99DRAFT_392884 [Mytilinidion resinicola]|uniref:Uncharacterized protein n=1 Tax=Mytilinidion resinicola TaxID=574789 RepID=A0A6A6YEN8_9PEZI|nr:uncharacterized protein BDZ99DRAFT_392884 [Mytilinidion resinicola]KAF2807261.1 hypothetical protein BDZ99DRAFT_392884 [Mytilinidion resinicola]
MVELTGRLRQIEYFFNGKTQDEEQLKAKQQGSIVQRIKRIEDGLKALSAKTSLIAEVEQLRLRHPELVYPPKPKQYREEDLQFPEPLQHLDFVMESAPGYPALASQLKALKDMMPLPKTETLAHLVELQPRIQAMSDRQVQQALEISELRKRTECAIISWSEIHILGVGRCFVEFDKRLREVERTVRRKEFKLEQEESET